MLNGGYRISQASYVISVAPIRPLRSRLGPLRASPWQPPSSRRLLLRTLCSTATQRAKTRSTLSLKALAQKPVILSAHQEDVVGRGGRYPAVIQEAYDNIQRFENCVVLTKVGGFYELYFDQAEEYAPQLNLKVAEKKTLAGRVPMVPFPFLMTDRICAGPIGKGQVGTSV